MRTIFTTGQAAKVAGKSSAFIRKAFDSGRLKGYRIPGSSVRRIQREHLIQFLKDNDLPFQHLVEEAVGKVCLLGLGDEVGQQVQDWIGSDAGTQIKYELRVFSASGESDFDDQAASMRLDCVVIDFAIGREEALTIARNLRERDCFNGIVIIGLLSDDDYAALSSDKSLFSETFRKPFDAALLAQRIKELVQKRLDAL